MIIKIFLGTSGSGKTTYITDNIIKEGTKEDFEEDGLKFCSVGNKILFGHYNVDKRCKGCDTLSMTAIDKIIYSLNKIILENKYSEVVLDGDRINCRKMLDFLIPHKDIVEVYWINTDIRLIFEDRPDCNKVFVKTTETKTKNMIQKYDIMKFKIIKIKRSYKEKWW